MSSDEEMLPNDCCESDFSVEFSGSESTEDSLSHDSSSNRSVDLAGVRDWCEINPGNLPNPPPRFPFTGLPSTNYIVDEEGDLLKYFNLFFDEGLVNLVTENTNNYAQQYHEQHPDKAPFRPVSADELRVFLGIFILQSIVKKPDMQQYWSKNPLLQTPFFLQAMPYRRFIQIKQFLHFSNNQDYDPETHPNPKLNKIWPVFQLLLTKFRCLLTPDRDITIDESLLLYKGRLGWKQYIPLKRARFGIKTYMLCESKSGYVWNMIIYTGKGTLLSEDYKGLPVSTQVVMDLMSPLLGKGYCLTMDSYYNSPQLADILVNNITDVYGTVQLKRKDMPSLKLKKGEIVGYQRGKVTAMKWKDKKDISLLSTIHSLEIVDTEKRGEIKKKPKCVVDYNDTMGGVDRVDQHLADYALPRKRGKKYYKKIFFHLLDLALWNSYILYCKNGGAKTPLMYRIAVVDGIMKTYLSDDMRPQAGRPSSTPTPTRLIGRHFPEYIPATEKKLNPTRQCAMCARVRDANNKKIRRESRFYCPDCNVALCVCPCFRVYHTVAQI